MCPEVKIHIECPYITGTVYALVLNNPFAEVVVGNIGNLYPTTEQPESIQIITRGMTKKNEIDEQTMAMKDHQWKTDDYEGNNESFKKQVSSDYFSEISSREDLIAYQK